LRTNEYAVISGVTLLFRSIAMFIMYLCTSFQSW